MTQHPIGSEPDDLGNRQLPTALQRKCVEFLTSIPNLYTSDARQAFLNSAGLDRQLQVKIKADAPPEQFFQLLIPTLFQYGTLKDGRHALKAVLKSAQEYVGQERREYSESLIRELDSILSQLEDIDTLQNAGAPRRKKMPIVPFLLLVLPTVIVVLVTMFLINWRIPTRFQAEVTVNRVAFTVGGNESVAILDAALPVQSITVGKFDEMTFTPRQLAVADPAQYLFAEDRYPQEAWTPLTFTGPITMTGEGEALQPSVTLESAESDSPGNSGRLDLVRVRPDAAVVLELRSEHVADLTLHVDGQEAFATLAMQGQFLVINDYVRLRGVSEMPYQTEGSLTYAAQLSAQNPLIEITGSSEALRLLLTAVAEKQDNPFSTSGIPVTALDFIRQGPQGSLETTLLPGVDARITYPKYPAIETVTFKAPDFLGLDALETCRIEEIALDKEHGGIYLRLNGVAGHISTGSAELPEDRRLSRFDTFWHSSKMAVLFTIAVWVFSTTVGGRKLWKGLAGGQKSE